MSAAIGAAAAGAAINSAGNIFGGLLANHQAKKTREFNAEQAQLNREYQTSERLAAQEFDLDMWNLNNEYNSLESQIERARAAGVNPNAILGGDYKTPTSSPVTINPMMGNAATDSSGGALGSAFINAGSNIGNNIGNFVKNMIDSKAAMKELQLNEKMINSNIDHNLASIQKLLSGAGVDEATSENIKKSSYWMDKLNPLQVQEVAARVTNWYNQNYKILQEIKNLEADEKLTYVEIDNKSASTDNIKANTAYTESQKKYQDTLNTYADRQQSAFTTQAESDAAIATLKAELAKEIGVPLDSPEFAFNWKLAINGKFEEYCDKVITPKEQSTWKPEDFRVPTMIPGGYNTFFGSWNPRKGFINPREGNHTYFPQVLSPFTDFLIPSIKSLFE